MRIAPLTYLSVCSGIEAASVAWEPLGWRPALLSEIETFPRAVLRERWGARDLGRGRRAGTVPLWGDFIVLRIRHLRRFGLALPDILVGGTPCQAFSIAGARGSLSDDRGNLSLHYVRLANAIDAARHRDGLPGLIVVWENVPGVLNTRDNAFGCLLAALVGADAPLDPGRRKSWPNAGLVVGPARTAAWRVLDAQYFGVAQQRKRVYVIASSGDRADPSAILFEPDGVRRHYPPSRGAQEDIAGTLATGSRSRGGWRLGADEAAAGQQAIAGTLKGNAAGADDNDARAGRLVAFRTSGNCGAWSTGDRIDALTTGTDRTSHLLAYGGNNTTGPIEIATARNACHSASGRMDFESETFVTCATREASHTLRGEGFDGSAAGTGRGQPIINQGPAAVRRLTVTESERLQGFSDGYTAIPWRGRTADRCPDGLRYKAIGNSMAVPVMRWLGERIAAQMIGRVRHDSNS